MNMRLSDALEALVLNGYAVHLVQLQEQNILVTLPACGRCLADMPIVVSPFDGTRHVNALTVQRLC